MPSCAQPLLLTAPDDGKDRLAISLNPNLREKRNTLGKDSSGKWKGDEVTHGVQVELEKLYADEPETAKALATVPLLLNHVQNRWWLGSAESEAAVADRIAEVRLSGERSHTCKRTLRPSADTHTCWCSTLRVGHR